MALPSVRSHVNKNSRPFLTGIPQAKLICVVLQLRLLLPSFTKSIVPPYSTRYKGHGKPFSVGEKHCPCSDIEETQGARRKNRHSRGLSRVSAACRGLSGVSAACEKGPSLLPVHPHLPSSAHIPFPCICPSVHPPMCSDRFQMQSDTMQCTSLITFLTKIKAEGPRRLAHQ